MLSGKYILVQLLNLKQNLPLVNTHFQGQQEFTPKHIYFRKIKLKADKSMPLVLSEFGGYSLATKGHIFNLSKAYGYGKTESREEFTKALEDLYRYEVIPAIKEAGLCATVLTQLSDVEDEINGLVTYDRAVEKADAAALRQVAKELKEAFASQLNETNEKSH